MTEIKFQLPWYNRCVNRVTNEISYSHFIERIIAICRVFIKIEFILAMNWYQFSPKTIFHAIYISNIYELINKTEQIGQEYCICN